MCIVSKCEYKKAWANDGCLFTANRKPAFLLCTTQSTTDTTRAQLRSCHSLLTLQLPQHSPSSRVLCLLSSPQERYLYNGNCQYTIIQETLLNCTATRTIMLTFHCVDHILSCPSGWSCQSSLSIRHLLLLSYLWLPLCPWNQSLHYRKAWGQVRLKLYSCGSKHLKHSCFCIV